MIAQDAVYGLAALVDEGTEACAKKFPHSARWQAESGRENYTETLMRIERRLSSYSPREMRNKLTGALTYVATFRPASRLFKL